MAFKKVESKSSGGIPFFDEWKKELSPEDENFLNEELISPKQIKQVSSGKGFLLFFDDIFSVFVWKNSVIGKMIKKSLQEECGNLILLQFEKGKKTFSFSIGEDDEAEVVYEEDKYDEGLYYASISNDINPPIAPKDKRLSIFDLPVKNTVPLGVITPTPSTKVTTKKRSDGAA